MEETANQLAALLQLLANNDREFVNALQTLAHEIRDFGEYLEDSLRDHEAKLRTLVEFLPADVDARAMQRAYCKHLRLIDERATATLDAK